jgi:hypothetical protein
MTRLKKSEVNYAVKAEQFYSAANKLIWIVSRENVMKCKLKLKIYITQTFKPPVSDVSSSCVVDAGLL